MIVALEDVAEMVQCHGKCFSASVFITEIFSSIVYKIFYIAIINLTIKEKEDLQYYS